MLYGGEDEDVLLGDNGWIARRITKIGSSYPFDNGIEWEMYPEPFENEVIRDIRRFDDVDYVEGDDKLWYVFASLAEWYRCDLNDEF